MRTFYDSNTKISLNYLLRYYTHVPIRNIFVQPHKSCSPSDKSGEIEVNFKYLEIKHDPHYITPYEIITKNIL